MTYEAFDDIWSNTKLKRTSTHRHLSSSDEKDIKVTHDLVNGDDHLKISDTESLKGLDLEIASILEPLKMPAVKKSNHQELFLKHFTFIVIFVPTTISILFPPTLNGDRPSLDLAAVITDGLMVSLVSWFIKFTVEWPWSWMLRIRDARSKILSIKPMLAEMKENVTAQDSTKVPPCTYLVEKNARLVQRLNGLELLTLLFCSIGILVGALLMLCARNYMVVEEARKKLVFSNFNICIFLLWGALKVVIASSEFLQRISVNHLNNFLHEEKVSLLEQKCSGQKVECRDETQESDSPENKKIGSMQREKFVKHYEDSQKDHYSKGIQELMQEITYLKQMIKKQQNTMLNLTQNHVSGINELKSVLGNVEDGVVSLKAVGTKAVDQKYEVSLRPFPLNLKKRASILPSDKKIRQTPTIIEENEDLSEHEDKEIVKNDNGKTISSKVSFDSEPSSSSNFTHINNCQEGNEQPKLCSMSETSNDPRYSLHGLPFHSSVKNVMTRQMMHENNDAFELGIDDFLAYDDYNSSYDMFHSSLDISNRDLVTIVEYIRVLWETMKQNFSLSAILKENTSILLSSLFEGFYFKIERNIAERHKNYITSLEIIKLVVWEFFTEYIFGSMVIIIDGLRSFHKRHLRPVKFTLMSLLLIFAEIPINILRVQMSIVLFIPKLFFKLFILSPLWQLKKEVSQSYSQISTTSEDMEQGHMREFHLAHFRSRTNKPVRTRKHVVNKLSKYLELASYEDGFRAYSSPVIIDDY